MNTEEKEKRTKEIKIRLTPSEHKRLLQIAADQQLASFMREVALSSLQEDLIAHIVKRADKHEKQQNERLKQITVPPELLRQLAQIGNNVNQIARVLNSTDSKNLELVKIAIELEAINQSLNEIKSAYAR